MKKILFVSDVHGDLNTYKKIVKREKPDYIFNAGD
jgi:predicted phosphodiesterase